MSIKNLFSKRQKILRGEVPDIFTYDNFSENFKVQILHIFDDVIGLDNYNARVESNFYFEIRKTLCREYGLFYLIAGDLSPKYDVINFFINENKTDLLLDLIELSFGYINQEVRENPYKYVNKKISPDEAITELNERFKENGLGFQFENNEIIKMDSLFVHSQITKPAIALLWNRKFLGANDEYMSAHNHYKNGRFKECLNDCLKAFESCIKTICKIKKWNYAETDSARKLIKICFENELVPTYLQNQFTSLQNLIESGVPTIRNKKGGHGQGEDIKLVDDILTRYTLNLTGTNIIFLIEQSGIN